MVQVLTVDPTSPREDRLQRAAAALAAGGVVALPTETFYGLSMDAFRPDARTRLNALKGKDEAAPLLLLLADREQRTLVCGAVPPSFDRLADAFWPGPLTLVVPAAGELGIETVAVRVPGLALPRRLAGALGRPITGISANRHRRPPCRLASDVVREFPSGLDLVLDGGPAPGGAPSTIVDLCGTAPRLLREGLVPLSALRPFLPDLAG